MSDESPEYDGPVIEFYISMEYDARTHRIFTKVPQNWNDMSADEKEIFLQREAEEYMHTQIEYGGIVHDSPAAAYEETKNAWGDTFDAETIEEMFS